MNKHTFAAIALAAAALPLATVAQTATPAPASGATAAATASKLARGEHKFIEEAGMGGMAEVQAGQIAQTKGASDQVKQFGSRMVQDHGKANEELKALAQAKGVALPAEMDRSHRRDLDKLNKASGNDFDKEYMSQMVSDHKKDVSAFKKMAEDAKDADVKAFAAKTLPTLQEHLKMAQSTEDAVKGKK